ncbi:MAG: response regulator transcription factor [Alistipes sp.]|nr:response regulator transcription factor [Alistipes sp.]
MNSKIEVLLVEDERMLAEILSDTLSDREFNVTTAYDGQQALGMLHSRSFDIVVTDVMMPKMDGFTLVRTLRGEGITTPVLFLTARSATEDVVRGFEVGGGDFLKKPFAIDELIVRIKALVGRVKGESIEDERRYTIGRYTFTPKESLLQFDNLQITLSARESAVLVRLCRAEGGVVEASAILKELWGDDTFFNLRSLNVYISRLRKHLATDPTIEIVSIRGVGYRLRTLV